MQDMFRKLRRKFIVINMVFVSVVLLIVFAALGFSTYQGLREQSRSALRAEISRGSEPMPPKFEIGSKDPARKPFASVPVFSVTLSEDGAIIKITGEYVKVSDEVVSAAVEGALRDCGQNGTVSSLGLRFMRGTNNDGIVIAFADMTSERQAMANFLVVSLLIGTGALGAFLLASLFLSNWSLRPIKRAWDQQQQFVADASHELKTPLTVILANSDILLSHREDTVERQAKWIEYIKAEADRMKKLVEELLFLAKSDQAVPQAQEARLNFSDAVWSGLLPFESIAFEKGISLVGEITPELYVKGKETELKQLVAILLDNAYKYVGKEGCVTLVAERQGEKVRLTVNNTGEPIDPKHITRLFERFYRADESRFRERGGYGLGLAIAKRITENHRGRISVESSKELGTTFTVLLPIRL